MMLAKVCKLRECRSFNNNSHDNNNNLILVQP